MQYTLEQTENLKPIQRKIKYLSDTLLDVEYDLRAKKRAQDQINFISEANYTTDEQHRYEWSEYARETLPDFERKSDNVI